MQRKDLTFMKTKKLVICALLAALTCASTMVIRIPTPTNGYINLGDCIVLLSGFLLGPIYGAAAGGIGSALSDLIAGYTAYVIPTLIIKALMALCGAYIYGAMKKSFAGILVGALIAEIIMVLGYFVCEATFLGYGAGAVVGIPGNITQAVGGIIFSCVIMTVFNNNKTLNKLLNK